MQTILDNIQAISAQFATERRDRQRRRELVKADFDRLAAAGFLLTSLPVAEGGVWESIPKSTGPICEMLRILAHGDPSVALVSAMHPGVLAAAGWPTVPHAPAPYEADWEAQRQFVFQGVREGHWWGTIVSEPGSGGDIGKTQTIARPTDTPGRYRITGQKHFGSGSGMTSFMHTIAQIEGQTGLDVFFLDMRGVPWDGSAGITLFAAWDGHGMGATQSHALTFTDFPATRLAWPGAYEAAHPIVAGSAWCYFTAVIVGVVEVALATARQQLGRRRASLRAYEQTEWSRVLMDGWLIQQAYAGMLRSIEQGNSPAYQSVLGKTAIAEMAESALLKLCRVLGGGTYSRHAPFGWWLEDVRALGFLRPPWGLAYDNIFNMSWEQD